MLFITMTITWARVEFWHLEVICKVWQIEQSSKILSDHIPIQVAATPGYGLHLLAC